MLKKFVLMLILAFTIQLGWAVANTYCMHETGKASQHFGHHDHQHEATPETQQSSKSKISANDIDCDFCHHSYTNVVTVQFMDYLFLSISGNAEIQPFTYQSYIPDSLTKPNWLRIN
ncbi:hypothetical protein LPB67_12675 [Undibacterium sp. Jales W-56]|uniref:hypothetical protein n=1 Tax=Undibacterium sp. Jales W-56 TaxID=2897325 RepID=UPI0021D1334E|nr:hypothetical protein [Undibacterium sp. Jales W-56]MCU6434626.1 hypothetical protein [Undibacterium sp. Jales W-56]